MLTLQKDLVKLQLRPLIITYKPKIHLEHMTIQQSQKIQSTQFRLSQSPPLILLLPLLGPTLSCSVVEHNGIPKLAMYNFLVKMHFWSLHLPILVLVLTF